MHVISKKVLLAFCLKHPKARAPMEAWHKVMERSSFADFNDVRRTYNSADWVDPFVVFNVNDYRIVAAIHFDRQKVYLREVLTHPEYDRWNDERRGRRR